MFGFKNAKEIIDLMALEIKGLSISLEKLEKSNTRLEKRLDNLNCEHLNQSVGYRNNKYVTSCNVCHAIISRVPIEETTIEVQEVKMHRNMIKLLEAKMKKGKQNVKS